MAQPSPSLTRDGLARAIIVPSGSVRSTRAVSLVSASIDVRTDEPSIVSRRCRFLLQSPGQAGGTPDELAPRNAQLNIRVERALRASSGRELLHSSTPFTWKISRPYCSSIAPMNPSTVSVESMMSEAHVQPDLDALHSQVAGVARHPHVGEIDRRNGSLVGSSRRSATSRPARVCPAVPRRRRVLHCTLRDRGRGECGCEKKPPVHESHFFLSDRLRACSRSAFARAWFGLSALYPELSQRQDPSQSRVSVRSTPTVPVSRRCTHCLPPAHSREPDARTPRIRPVLAEPQRYPAGCRLRPSTAERP